MVEGKSKARPMFVFSMVGGMIAYYIGASTGTGQEFFQVYSTHGMMGAVGSVIQHILLAALALIVILICKKYNLSTPKECFVWFLGKYVGSIIYYYTMAFVFCTMVQLISGTGSLLTQYYGWPYYVGAVLLAVLCIFSVLFGFKRVIDIISKIAPFILIVMAIVSLISLIDPVNGLKAGTELALTSDEVVRTSDSWIGSMLLHHTYLILFVIPYYVSCYLMDPKAGKKETVLWIVISYSVLTVMVVLMILSHVANMSIAIGTAAPNLAIAMVHAPALAAVLVVMIVAASFTTTAPIAVITAEYFAEAGTKRYKIIGSILVVLALIVSFAGSYAEIINILVSVSGRVGVAVYIFAIIYRIYKKVTDPQKAISK